MNKNYYYEVNKLRNDKITSEEVRER